MTEQRQSKINEILSGISDKKDAGIKFLDWDFFSIIFLTFPGDAFIHMFVVGNCGTVSVVGLELDEGVFLRDSLIKEGVQ